MVANLLDRSADIDAVGKQAILSLTGPRLLTRIIGCQVTSDSSPRTCEARKGVKMHTHDFEGRLLYDATSTGKLPSCYRNSSKRAQYQQALQTARSDECRAQLKTDW